MSNRTETATKIIGLILIASAEAYAFITWFNNTYLG